MRSAFERLLIITVKPKTRPVNKNLYRISSKTVHSALSWCGRVRAIPILVVLFRKHCVCCTSHFVFPRLRTIQLGWVCTAAHSVGIPQLIRNNLFFFFIDFKLNLIKMLIMIFSLHCIQNQLPQLSQFVGPPVVNDKT